MDIIEIKKNNPSTDAAQMKMAAKSSLGTAENIAAPIANTTKNATSATQKTAGPRRSLKYSNMLPQK